MSACYLLKSDYLRLCLVTNFQTQSSASYLLFLVHAIIVKINTIGFIRLISSVKIHTGLDVVYLQRLLLISLKIIPCQLQ